MKRSSLLVLSAALFDCLTSVIHTAATAIGGYACAAWDWAYLPTYKVLADPVERQDLKRGEMPEQPAPRPSVARVTRDQRPALRLFTLPRTEFAF